MRIRQVMATVGERRVRLLCAGAGAPVLLIHGSPNTAWTLAPLIEALARDFLVLAPDTPGNGASDPLPVEIGSNADRWAEALAALLDALSLPQVAVYGSHTGAVFATELARLYPDRVSALVCDGYPLWTQAEAAELADGYLQPIQPDAGGAYLARLWTKVIDQNWYFPWHVKSANRRIERSIEDLDRLQQRAMELLMAGDAYRVPYAAALKTDGRERLLAVRVPCHMHCMPQDILHKHLARVPDAAHLTRTTVSDTEAAAEATRQWFRQYPPATASPIIAPASSRFLALPTGDIYCEGEIGNQALWLHDAGESSAQYPIEAPAETLRIDLPGHGESTVPWPQDRRQIKPFLDELLAALDLDPARARIKGAGLGQQLARLARAEAEWSTPDKTPVPDIRPRADGAHLLAAWHYGRFRSQYRIWNQHGPGQRLHAPLPDAETLHQMTLDVLRAGPATLEATLPWST